jgi:hypothetical protein
MSDLPDLDTSSISFVAYWNAHDHGGADISPSTALSDSKIESYVAYDNGFEAVYDLGYDGWDTYNFDGSIKCKVRVKTDGWIVVYKDLRRSSNWWTHPGTSKNLDPQIFEGTYNVGEINSSFWPGTRFGNVIDRVRQELDQGGSLTFNHGDVGYYNYEYTSAAGLDIANTGYNNGSGTLGVESGTTLHTLSAVSNVGDSDGYIKLDNTEYQASDTSVDYVFLDVNQTPEMPGSGESVDIVYYRPGYGAYDCLAVALWE